MGGASEEFATVSEHDSTAAGMSAEYVGREALLEVRATNATVQEPMFVRVRVVDAKMSYGRLGLQVEPTEGIGNQWVTLQRLTFTDE